MQMDVESSSSAIGAALLAAGCSAPIRAQRERSGGCIHRVIELDLDDGARLIAKINAASALNMFQEEAESLRALAATRTVIVPQPLSAIAHRGHAVLLMTCIEEHAATDTSWTNFGRDLAALHRADAGKRYGFHIANHIGSTPQPNDWCDDWVEFNALHRLGHQLQLARHARLLDREEAEAIQRVIARLDQFIPRRPPFSLIHGDLWSGNVIATGLIGRATCAVIDPACSIGDGWADVAMMKLFGGFPPVCFAAYSADAGGDPDDLGSRIAVYQLYHVLNHVNLFGRGYAAQAMSLARSLR